MISMQYQGNENTQSCQVEAALLMKYQNLVTKLKGNVLQLEGEISKQILLKVNGQPWTVFLSE